MKIGRFERLSLFAKYMNIEMTIGLQSISIYNLMEYCKSKQC